MLYVYLSLFWMIVVCHMYLFSLLDFQFWTSCFLHQCIFGHLIVAFILYLLVCVPSQSLYKINDISISFPRMDLMHYIYIPKYVCCLSEIWYDYYLMDLILLKYSLLLKATKGSMVQVRKSTLHTWYIYKIIRNWILLLPTNDSK